ncbi:MAG: electron transport complex subunit RsxG [Gammaproteobacteria bacterium]|nr:electron transport complex subunit RsxG [Gammaproteobacteria bacterium]
MNTSTTPGLRQRLGYHPVLLGAAVLVTSAILFYTNIETRDKIALRMEEDLQASLAQVVPPSLYDNQILKDTVTIRGKDVSGKPNQTIYYRARMHGKIVAFAFPAVAYGYSGEIDMIMGVDTHGTLLGVRIIAHAETPGLGDKIETGKSDWILGFKGKSLTDPGDNKWAVKKDGGVFDQFTGATITPRGVVAGIHYGLEEFAAHRQQLLDDATGNDGSDTDGK